MLSLGTDPIKASPFRLGNICLACRPSSDALRLENALENPIPPSRIPDATRLRSNEEMEVLFEGTSAILIRLQSSGQDLPTSNQPD